MRTALLLFVAAVCVLFLVYLAFFLDGRPQHLDATIVYETPFPAVR